MSSSYDELLKQVASLKQENSQLRNELQDNSCHLTKLENEASNMKHVLTKPNMDDDQDEVYDDYDEEGIHEFVQGGGGESWDINQNDEDVSPNDIGPLKPTFSRIVDGSANLGNDVREKSRSPPATSSDNVVSKPQMMSDGDYLSFMRELNNERNVLLSDIEEEDKHRKWYYEQLEVIAQKIESLHVSDTYNRQTDMARRQLEFEAKRVQDSFEQNMGDNDQIVQRQEVRLQKIQAVETEMLKLQQQHKLQVESGKHSLQEKEEHDRNGEINTQQVESGKHSLQEKEEHDRNGEINTQQDDNRDTESSDSSASAVSIATQTATGGNDVANMTVNEDPNASINLSSLYHGAWPMTPSKKDLEYAREGGSVHNPPQQPQDLASIMSFNSLNTASSQGSGPSQPAANPPQQPPLVLQQDPAAMGQHPQQLGTKVEMVYSLLSMLGTHDKDDMSRTLLAMSSSQDSCIAMRQSGCMPLLIQLLHGSDKDSGLLGNTRGSKSARARAAAALHNIVHSHPDDKRGRREARVLRLLEQIRAHCDQLRESSSDEEEEGRSSRGSRTQDMDHHPGPAVAALMKLSFDEEHRHAICSLGGVQAIAELIEVDNEVNGSTSEQYNITMRRYGCMALTNLTFGDGTNKALLCSMKGFMEALVCQLQPQFEDLCQVAASVLRNLSWKADLASKKTLREVGGGTTLMKSAMAVKKEATLKSILSALWNLSAHGSENKADICAVEGALEFLVSTLTYKSPSKQMAVVENGGGILRNISSHITVREDYRQTLRKHGCLQILLKQLRSTSLTIVSNACGTLWNLSARCLEDQKALWDMGAVGMLKNLVNSKHQMISMGSSAALKNLLAACPSIKDMKMDQKSHTNRPTLHVRKQRALEAEIDQSLSETCENLESPRDSPTENVRTEKEQSRFVFPNNVNVITNDVEPRRPMVRGPIYPRSTSGENTPVTESKLRSPHRVSRSGSQDSVGSTHSDISHDRIRFHHAMKSAKNFHDRQGGSLDRKHGPQMQRYNSDGNCEKSVSGNSNRILQVMQEVAQHAGIDANIQKGQIAEHGSGSQQTGSNTARKDGNFSLPHALLYRSFTNPSIPHHAQHMSNGAYCSPGYGMPPGNQYQNHPGEEDDEQPIDYSMKCDPVQNKSQGHIRRGNLPQPPPIMPKYGNFVGPNNLQVYPVMHHSFPSQPVNPNIYHVRHNLPMIHQMVPVVPQFNAYAETDLDNDQPTDFSVRYAEDDEHYTDQPVSYNMQYQESDPNCTDCKLEAAIRTSDQYVSGFNEDQTMTFYTEGTPLYNLSTATSMTDLSNRFHEKDDLKEKEMKPDNQQDETQNFGSRYGEMDKRSGSGSKLTDSEKQSRTDSHSTDQQTGTTVVQGNNANYRSDHSPPHNHTEKDDAPDRSFHIPADDDHSQDQIKTYCEEGTPICFSRVSSLSSLHSSEAQDRQENKSRQQMVLQSIEETERGKTPPRPVLKNSPGNVTTSKFAPVTGRQKLLSDSDVHSDDISEKEHKTVTFDDNHQVEETPLMFSRCSSLSSLGSFDAFSVHSDVVSEYSRRASEVVSPSELPDSPSETMPPSPKQSKSPEPGMFSDKINTVKKVKKEPDHKASEQVVLKDFISTNMNEVNSFKPVPKKKLVQDPNLNRLETLSTMSKDAPVVYADEGTPPKLSDTMSLLSALTFEEQSETKENEQVDLSCIPQNVDKTVSKENYGMMGGAQVAPVDVQKSENSEDQNQSILNQSDDKENSSMSEVSEGEEDILAHCISLAMPISARKMRRSSSDNAIKKKTSVSKLEIQKNKSSGKQTNVQSSKPKSARRLSDITKNQGHEGSEDTVKSFASEDIPQTSVPIEKQKHLKAKGMIRSGSAPVDIQADAVKSFASAENQFVKGPEVAKQQARPKPTEKPVNMKTENVDTVKNYAYDANNQRFNQGYAQKAKHLSKLQIMIREDLEGCDSYGDSVKSYATEDTPMVQSAAASPGIGKSNILNIDSSQCMEYVSKVEVHVSDDCVKSYAIEGTPYNGSIPTSPKHEKNQNNTNFKFKYVGGTMPTVEVEDTVQAYATEDTPLNFSRTTSLSDLSIRTSDEPVEDKLPTKSPSGPVLDDSHDQQSDNSSLMDENDELLSELIQSAMPKGKVSRRLNMDRAAEGSETEDTFKFASPPFQENEKFEFKPQRTSSHVTSNQMKTHNQNSQVDCPQVYAVEGTPLNFSNATSLSDLTIDSHEGAQHMKVNVARDGVRSSADQSSASHVATFGTSADDSVFLHTESCDSLKTYNMEGTPITFSRNDSLSSLSIIDEDAKDLEKLKKLCEVSQTTKPQLKEKQQNHWTKHGDEILQREVEGQSSDETKSGSVKGMEDRLMKPANYSHGSSLSSIPSQENQELLEQSDIAKDHHNLSQNEELTRKDSLSSLSSDSGDDDPESEEALLDECISSALPKSRSENKSKFVSKLPRASPNGAIAKDSMSASFSGRGSSTNSLTHKDSKIKTESSRNREKEYSRMARSCSSMEEIEDLNKSFRQRTHESRITTWKKEHVDNRPEAYQFSKPTDESFRRGAWRRSRSQDSDGFLKRQKNHSNMELAQSYNSCRDVSESPWVLRSSVDNMTSEHLPIDDNRVFEEIARFTQSRMIDSCTSHHFSNRDSSSSVEKVDSEKPDDQDLYEQEIRNTIPSHLSRNSRVDSRENRNADNNDIGSNLSDKKENEDDKVFGGAYVNYGFDENAGSDNTDSADVTVVNSESANITMTNDNSGGFDVTFYEPEYEEGALESPNCSFEEEISPEDERLLEANASLIVSEIQNNKMTGSSVDEDMFIENETLSLVSGGYTSDTASEVSLTWSAKSEQLSEFSESTTISNDDSSISTGAKIVKPNRKVAQEVDNTKAVRGRRKPLYSPRTNSNVQRAPVAKIDTNLKRPSNVPNRSNQVAGKLTPNNANKKGPVRTTSHPQACSTPTRAPPKPRTSKPSPPQQPNKPVTNKSPNSKTSPPSRLPTATAGRKGNNSVEKPKPPIKQRTFVKDSPSTNAPVIDVNDSFELDENGNNTNGTTENNKNMITPERQLSHSSSHCNRNSDEINTECWSKALETYNFIVDATDENCVKEQKNGQRNSGNKQNSVKNTKGGNSGGNMNKNKPGVNTPGKMQTKLNKSSNVSNLKKTYSGTSLTKSGSGASLNKSGSGVSLNKSGSGAGLNKSGSGASLNKTGSGTIFSKSSSGTGLNKTGSNPNLKKVSSKGDLKKSNSNASLKSNSRPSTPVGRKNSNASQMTKKAENSSNKTSPQNSNSNVTAKKTENQSNKSLIGTPDNRKSGTGVVGNKRVNGKVAGMWKKEDTESPNKGNASKLPVSTNSAGNSPRGQQNKVKMPQQKVNTINQKSSAATVNRTESPYDGLSRSSTYDKLDSTNESSRLPCLDDIENDVDNDMQEHLTKLCISKSNEEQNLISDANKSAAAEKLSPKSPEDFDLKSLEKKIDTSTWKKKKPKNEMLCLPNADETAKSLEAVRAVLNASMLNENSLNNTSVIDSTFSESFIDRSMNSSAWTRYKEDSYSSCAPSDDEESIWIRRDADTSRSEPQLSKFSIKEKKQKRKSKGEGHSFLPIKAVKQMFSSKKKSASSTSLASSRDSNLDKSDAEDEKSSLKRKIFSKKKSDKKSLDKVSRNGSVSSLESTKTSPQSALVPPFNYTPSTSTSSVKQQSSSSTTELNDSRDQDNSVFVKPLPVKSKTLTTHATKTEMLLARRRQSYLNSLKVEENSEDDKKRQGCMVTTV